MTDRLAGRTQPEPLWNEGVPDHIDVPIRDWLYDMLRSYDMATPVAVRLKLPSSILKSRDPYAELATLDDRMNPILRLEIIDATLGCIHQALQEARWNQRETALASARVLEGILREGDSAFRVSEDGSRLERRMDETLHATYDKAVEAGASKAETAAAHLRAAFSEAYGIRPDPSAAYSRAIKAVEAVANPLFLPNAPEPTLGKVRAHLDQGQHKYEMAISDKTGMPAGIDAVVAMISLLWHGQRDRHEGGPTSAPVTQEAAETAVHTAAILVHWFSNGSIRKK
ncbi:hypothetical protein PS783_37965 (plasmid) [Streptomyces enissocaesilis]|uniref:hypothetical protein n=1 Tax=Streptomyces TaxID=1883 RepID=UPI001CBF0A1C|nr:hypothetical protein [Streptomyces sp. A144]UAX58397.1 hypothetical protein K5X85_35240 [Streptomyces sp. A144]WDI23408.1 hypothetical protein PS783_37965 [Streptomyces enissocaesilis]